MQLAETTAQLAAASGDTRSTNTSALKLAEGGGVRKSFQV
jgi:cellobiose-specific phosphotransferase system component IIA